MPHQVRPAPSTPPRAGAAGFTLLEAVVALALVAVATLPLYAFFSRTLDGLYRAAEVNRESETRLSAIAFLTGLNPTERPAGEETLGGLRIRWTSQERVPATDVMAYPRGMGIHQVTLYDVTAEILDGPRVRATLELRLIGYKRVREMLPFAAPGQVRG